MANEEVDAMIHRRGMAWLEKQKTDGDVANKSEVISPVQDELQEVNHDVNSPTAPHNL